jgi:hypothetical protein
MTDNAKHRGPRYSRLAQDKTDDTTTLSEHFMTHAATVLSA